MLIDFIPTTKEELKKLGWEKLDIILISGDTYIDSAYSGITIIGKILIKNGYKVGIISQPDITSDKDITRLGEPSLFWGISAGLVDSMVANYTATKKPRKSDDFTPGGINNRRPDRATIKYCNLIRQYFKDTVPLVLGGIEASLRRTAHFDYWSNKVRKSLIFDAKADVLVYGMGEKTVLQLAKSISEFGLNRLFCVRGICYIDKKPNPKYIDLPSFDEVSKDKDIYAKSFDIFYKNNDPITAKGLNQLHDSKSNRYLIQNPPEFYASTEETDENFNLNFQRDVHPYYKKQGEVKALQTIMFSIPTHQGCYGECSFCAISVHQGTTIRSRSKESILKEAQSFTKDKRFKGIISDVGGPTANMYGYECDKKIKKGDCDTKSCVGHQSCNVLKPNHKNQIDILRSIRKMDKVKKVFVASGIRYDLIADDKQYGDEYLQEIVAHHVSGQLKIAPEHTEPKVLKLMNKPTKNVLTNFKKKFDTMSKKMGKKQFLTYYLIAGHPGSTKEDMVKLKQFANSNLKLNPEQVQVYTPTPSTYSTLMYYTEKSPFTGEKIFVEKDNNKKQVQKDIVTKK
jgi:uncharacterized radical SAM protein YgiQ